LAREVRSGIAAIPGADVLEDVLLGVEASHDLDLLQVLIDVSGTGTSGYQAADWLRDHHYVDIGMSDHRRILATMSFADDRYTAERLISALIDWSAAVSGIDKPPTIDLPTPSELQLDTVILPRDAFFGHAEMVDASRAAGRVAAEQLTPYPPGIPAVVPGSSWTTQSSNIFAPACRQA
jgi:lysine decarboxylase